VSPRQSADRIREIGKTERRDAFIHAGTHEVKTPLASLAS